MRKTEVARWHRGVRVAMVVASVVAMVGLGAGTAVAGQAVEEDDVLPETATRPAAPASDEIVAEEQAHEVVDPCAEYPSHDPEVPALWKLGRGFHNLVFGFPAEVVRNPVIEILKADTVFGVGAAATEGVVIGVGKGFWRVGAGFLDIVTFPIEDSPWYDCRVLPEYPF